MFSLKTITLFLFLTFCRASFSIEVEIPARVLENYRLSGTHNLRRFETAASLPHFPNGIIRLQTKEWSNGTRFGIDASYLENGSLLGFIDLYIKRGAGKDANTAFWGKMRVPDEKNRGKKISHAIYREVLNHPDLEGFDIHTSWAFDNEKAFLTALKKVPSGNPMALYKAGEATPSFKEFSKNGYHIGKIWFEDDPEACGAGMYHVLYRKTGLCSSINTPTVAGRLESEGGIGWRGKRVGPRPPIIGGRWEGAGPVGDSAMDVGYSLLRDKIVRDAVRARVTGTATDFQNDLATIDDIHQEFAAEGVAGLNSARNSKTWYGFFSGITKYIFYSRIDGFDPNPGR